MLAALLLGCCLAAAPSPTWALQAQNTPAPQAAPANPKPSPDAGPSDTDDIRDIRGPISIPYVWLWVIYVVGALVLAIGVVLLIILLWKREPKPVKARPAHEIALEKLKAIRPLMHPDRAREFSFAASEIIREYIEAQFRVLAARHTTEEFLRQLLEGSDSPLAAHRAKLEDFMRYCDLAKFARWQLSERDMDSMYDSARDFVLATLPGLEVLNQKASVTPAPEAAPAPPPAVP